MNLRQSAPWSKYIWREPIPMSVCYKIEARRRSLTVLDQPKWPLSHMCTCVISSLSNATVMSLSTNSPAETCDTLLLLVISVCCHFIYNLFVLQAYKIESSRRSLTAILGDPVGFTKMTSYSLLLYLLQDLYRWESFILFSIYLCRVSRDICLFD